MSLDLSKLVNLKTTATGWQAQCPACFARGADRTGNHLGIFKSGAFHCIAASSEPGHNRQIRALVRGDGTVTDIEYIEEPKLTTDKVYPESTLAGLLPNYEYWIARGMKESVLRALENGIAAKETRGQLAGRSVFPVRDLQRRIMGFSGRLIEENSFAPKWKHMARMSRAVYPWHVTGPAIRAAKTAVLVESVGDLLGCASHDIKPVLCIFGLNLNGLIISTLVGADVRRVIVALNRDSDPRKGQAAAERIATKLEGFFGRVEIRLPSEPWKDWGECAEGGEAGAAELARFRAEVES